MRAYLFVSVRRWTIHHHLPCGSAPAISAQTRRGEGKVGGEQLFALGSGMKTNIGGYLGALVWVLGNRTNTHTTRVPMLRFTAAAAAAIICTK